MPKLLFNKTKVVIGLIKLSRAIIQDTNRVSTWQFSQSTFAKKLKKAYCKPVMLHNLSFWQKKRFVSTLQ